LKYALLWKRKR